MARYQEVVAREEVQSYRAKQSQLAPEGNALEQELATVYRDAARRIVDLFTRIRAFQQRARQDLGNPPANVEPLPALAGAHLLDKVQLFDLDGDKQTWPPPATFAATYAESMPVPLHPSAAWWQAPTSRYSKSLGCRRPRRSSPTRSTAASSRTAP
jgi:hypothetical protein